MNRNGWVPRTKEQVEGQHIIDVAGLVEQQNCGRERWITTRVVLTDANCADADVASHAQWLIDNPRAEVTIIDKRSCR